MYFNFINTCLKIYFNIIYFSFLVCPHYRHQFIPSTNSLKEDVRIEMDLMPYRGVWDNILGKIIPPIHQGITFNSNNTKPLAFNVTLNQQAPIQLHFNTDWSRNIDAVAYKENENV